MTALSGDERTAAPLPTAPTTASTTTAAFRAPGPDALLRAVHDSASDLASVRDRAVILAALVRRTRALLGADMAYLSLNDLDAGETWIHVTDGVRTPAYAAIRMPLGTGILGAVAAGGASVHTDDYLADVELNHLPGIDAIVADEGVRAISGEPLRVDGHLVGALLVAHRTPAAMPAEGRAALRLLALQAAVALEQTRRAAEIAQLREAVDRVGRRAEAAEREVAAGEGLLALDAALTAVVADGGCTAVVTELASHLGAPVVLVDPDGRPRCGTPGTGDPSGDPAVDPAGGTEVAVADGRRVLGRLSTPAPVERAAPALARGALAVRLALRIERELVAVADRSTAALLDDLFDGRPHGGDLADGDVPQGVRDDVVHARAAAHGLDLRSPVASLVVLAALPDRQRSTTALRPLVAHGGGVVAVHAGHVCLLRPAGDPDLGERAEQVLAAAGVPAVVGWAAAPAAGAGPAARAHAEAVEVARAAHVLGWRSGHVDRARLGVAGLLVGGHDEDVVARLVERQLGPVLTYDREHGTHLATTAAAVLETGSRSAAAARLFVHVNTVRQRLERIDVLLGTGWDTAPRSLDVQVALRLDALRRRPRGTGTAPGTG